MNVREGIVHANPETLRGLYGLKYPAYCSQDDVTKILEKLEKTKESWSKIPLGESMELAFDET